MFFLDISLLAFAEYFALMSFKLLVSNYLFTAFTFVHTVELQSIQVFLNKLRHVHEMSEIFALFAVDL